MTDILVLPDTPQRARIARDLDINLLVEAGAGAGKTTEMIARMLALVSSGRGQVEQIAAVTFTRKAAAELRERFQNGLEQAIVDARDQRDTMREQRLDTALRSLMQRGRPVVGVTDAQDRLVGLLTVENLGEMMMVHSARPEAPVRPWGNPRG